MNPNIFGPEFWMHSKLKLNRKGRSQSPRFPVPTFLSIHVSQSHVSTCLDRRREIYAYESVVSLTSRLEEHLTLIIFLIHRKKRATQKANKKKKIFFFFFGLTPPPLPLPRQPTEQIQTYFFLSWSFLHLYYVFVLVSCYFSCFCGYLICLPDASW